LEGRPARPAREPELAALAREVLRQLARDVRALALRPGELVAARRIEVGELIQGAAFHELEPQEHARAFYGDEQRSER